MKLTPALLAVTCLLSFSPAWAQDHSSPDQQQQNHPENLPSPQANQPSTPGTPHSDSRSPDLATGTDTGKKSKKAKNKNNAHQAHGTPHPAPPADK